MDIFFRQYDPSPALEPYVKCYWMLEYDAVPPVPESILPDGCMEMVFHYGDKYEVEMNGEWSVQPMAILVGQITRSIRLKPQGRTGIFSIRFHPWGLYALSGMPASLFTDRNLSLEDVLGSHMRYLHEQLQVGEPLAKVAAAEQALLAIQSRRAKKGTCNAERVRPIITHIGQSAGNSSVQEMAGMANLSIRQYNRIINEVTGLSPKQYARIIRLKTFYDIYRQEDYNTFTLALHAAGYYDQAHFIRDFRSITGNSPSGFFPSGDMAALINS